jgi:hypothetical protein
MQGSTNRTPFSIQARNSRRVRSNSGGATEETGEGGLTNLALVVLVVAFLILILICRSLCSLISLTAPIATMWLQNTLTCLLACAMTTRAAVQADTSMKSIPVSTTSRTLSREYINTIPAPNPQPRTALPRLRPLLSLVRLRRRHHNPRGPVHPAGIRLAFTEGLDLVAGASHGDELGDRGRVQDPRERQSAW